MRGCVRERIKMSSQVDCFRIERRGEAIHLTLNEVLQMVLIKIGRCIDVNFGL